ncbi:MAG: glucose-6-phosphate dehydrogenase, partial [Candidatus Omnitrophica bacterium]|nr:glucose-6-phosphate dehydrogenase [Candidatus Omnitrophota bacterium]
MEENKVKAKVKPFVMIIFGGSGDLSQRKLLPALYHLYCDEKYFSDFAIIGMGMPEFSDAQYGEFIGAAINKNSPEQFDTEKYNAFARHLGYISGDLGTEDVYRKICEYLAGSRFSESEFNLLFYLAIPPKLLPAVVSQLKKVNLCKGPYTSKIIVEKPFGVDRESASGLNKLLLGAFEEKQIYRIDHYLGKDTVQNILYFRFGNSIFEPLWNRRYIDHIQITVAEDIGIEHRGAFYEQSGVVRDIVQNHILQLVALVAMEPPVGFEADLIRDEKEKVFRTFRALDTEYIDKFMVRGQYAGGSISGKQVPGYRGEKAVSPGSDTPTFFAGKFYIDNWRFSDVPFYVRTGKRMRKRATEIYVQFKQPPLGLFGKA